MGLKSTLALALLWLSSPAIGQKCMGQSCAIAALSGSTNESFDDIVKGLGKEPKGSNSAGRECITKYYKQLGIKAPQNLPAGMRAIVPPPTEKHRRQSCKAFINVFARGTTEMGTMGQTVGPALARALGRQWDSQGVSYNANMAGNNCIGFPGGVACRDQLARLASKCPDSKFVLSGYSQGAMVARICAAFSDEAVKKRIKGIIGFGDPFNGASVKGFPQEAVKSVCSAADGVCQGAFKITAAHFAYMGSSISEAAKWINERAKT